MRFRQWLAQRLAAWSYRVGGGSVIRTSVPLTFRRGIDVPEGNERGFFGGITVEA